MSWLCFGDFNRVLNLNKKIGGNEKQLRMVSEFRKALKECELGDLGFTGYPFTWSNRRFGYQFIEERLNRFLCNTSWGNCFQERTTLNLVTWSSDHHPIFMEVLEKGKGIRYIRRTFQRIHYEDMWSSYERCQEIVKCE